MVGQHARTAVRCGRSVSLLDLLLGIGIIAAVTVAIRTRIEMSALRDRHHDSLVSHAERRTVLGDRIRAITHERDDATAAHTEALGRILALETELDAAKTIVATEILTAEQRDTLLKSVCAHCGGIHSHACPRVKRLQFSNDGSSVVEVEFWPEGRWDATRVKWIEDLPPVAEPE